MKTRKNIRRCKHCGQDKLIHEFHVYDKSTGARRHECVACYRLRMNASYLKNKETKLASARLRYAENPSAHWTPERREKANQRARESTRELRRFVLDHYGAFCACCGEREDAFLTIDHINSDGAQRRKEHGVSGALYRWIIKNNFPDDFQILCFNCNCGRYHNGGRCPHHGRFNDYSAS